MVPPIQLKLPARYHPALHQLRAPLEIQRRRPARRLLRHHPLPRRIQCLLHRQLLTRPLRLKILNPSLRSRQPRLHRSPLQRQIRQQVRIVVLNLANHFPLLHRLPFHHMHRLHRPRHLALHIQSPVQRIIRNHLPNPAHILLPRQKHQPQHHHRKQHRKHPPQDPATPHRPSHRHRRQIRFPVQQGHGPRFSVRR